MERVLPWLAWAVILGVVGTTVWLTSVAPQPPADPAAPDPVGTRVMEIQSRVAVGSSSLLGQPDSLRSQMEALNTGPVDQRIRFAVLAGALGGSAEAAAGLQDLRAAMMLYRITPTPEQEEVLGLLERRYADDELTPEEQATLRARLGWFGELALDPEGARAPARRAAMLMLGGVLAAIVVALVGLVSLVVMIALAASGRMKARLGGPVARHGVYAETFAIWLALHLGLTTAASLAPPEWSLQALGAAILLGLVALGWTAVRGVPWSQVRRDIGWAAGEQPAMEPFCGMLMYAVTIPLAVAALFVTQMAAGWFAGPQAPDPWAPTGGPAHPIVVMAGGGWGRAALLFVVAAVIAPIVEEIMFRGVLYRHLREVTRGAGVVVSVGFSALVGGAVFALLHPQGLLAAPALGIVAVGLAVAREWRGSLVAPMVLHGINNGVVVLLMVFLMSG